MSDLTFFFFTHQSFSRIAKATPDQLQNLPGFGQVKVKNITNALNKPFRNQATNSIATSLSQQAKHQKSQPENSGPTASTTRQQSPTWDIEVDDAPSSDAEDNNLPARSAKSRGKQKAVPRVFDIDLDLNSD